jgi:hypothetical protein
MQPSGFTNPGASALCVERGARSCWASARSAGHRRFAHPGEAAEGEVAAPAAVQGSARKPENALVVWRVSRGAAQTPYPSAAA